jgi:hypothetical protein
MTFYSIDELIEPTIPSLCQSNIIKFSVPLILKAIENNNHLPKSYRLKLIQGTTFIRVNIIRKINEIIVKNILIINCCKDSKLSIDGKTEFRNNVTKICFDNLTYSIPESKTADLKKYIAEKVIPFIEGYTL